MIITREKKIPVSNVDCEYFGKWYFFSSHFVDSLILYVCACVRIFHLVKIKLNVCVLHPWFYKNFQIKWEKESKRTSKYLCLKHFISSTFICLRCSFQIFVPFTNGFCQMSYCIIFLSIVNFCSPFVFVRVLFIRCSERVHLLFEFLTPKYRLCCLLGTFMCLLSLGCVRMVKLNVSKIAPNRTEFTPLDAQKIRKSQEHTRQKWSNDETIPTLTFFWHLSSDSDFYSKLCMRHVRTYLISNFIPQIVDIIHFLVDLAMFNLWNIFRRTWMFPNGMIFRPNFLGNSNRSKTFSKKVSKESIIVLIEKLESRQKDVQTFDPFF